MKISYLISSLNYGGAEKQAILDANMMAHSNEVFFIYFYDGPQRGILSQDVKLLHLKKKSYLITAFRLAWQIKKHNIQIIHSSLYASMIISALCSFFCRTKIIWHFHSHEYGLPVLNGLLYKWLGKLPAIKKIVFVNNELRIFHTERFKFPLSKTGILYNTSSVPQSFRSYTLSEENTIGYIGRLVGLKRINLLIECSDYLNQKGVKEYNIIIVGDGSERHFLEDLVHKKKLDNKFMFTGFQSDTQFYLNKFDLFAMPSEEECLSIALIDAGVAGLPSVAFDVGGNNEIIDNNKTGFIVNTREDFFEKIYCLVTNKNLREQMGKAANIHCSDKFGKEKHLVQLNALYKELAIC